MEATRLHYENQPPKRGNAPAFPPLPPTRLSPQMQDVPAPPVPGGHWGTFGGLRPLECRRNRRSLSAIRTWYIGWTLYFLCLGPSC